ncbi:hypothetical protein LTR56_000166 [Elasticomyces elasticus]|nr:hypothetical protein LTR56_000166 [Elasticomyces elasticus]KAK3667154.1 hypothetical protein LTR22_002019 [Elasticomyces elasticus]KAK4932928.1 hypothetical protein LTR49_000885 [Elasticomyces elasticus]KAK5768667.1 hypothetical protein LTS12_001092 [Elasticomyces elasticus]
MSSDNAHSKGERSCSVLEQLYDAVDKILSHHSDLEMAASFRICSPMADRTSETAANRERTVLKDLKNLADLRRQLAMQQYNDDSTHGPLQDRGEAARTFFGTPELLEMALLDLSSTDLLRAEYTSRAFRDTITSSPLLRRKLFRETAEGLPLRTLGFVGSYDYHNKWLGFPIQIYSAFDTEGFLNFCAEFYSDDGKLPVLSERVKHVFVSQPPIKDMAYSGRCCGPQVMRHGNERDRAREGYLSRPEGLRVGDLYEAAKVDLERHKVCFLADRELLNAEGYVKNIVHFSGRYDPNISQDDPIQKGARKALEKKVELDNRICAYMRAKNYAYQRGEPIPTLAEHEMLATDNPEAYHRACAISE